MRTRKIPKSRNPIAPALRAPIFRKKVIRSKKIYVRKARTQSGPFDHLDNMSHGNLWQLRHSYAPSL